MSVEAIKAIQMVYANTTEHDWPDDIWDAICQAIEAEKHEVSQEPVAEVEEDGVMRFKPTNRHYKVGDKLYLHPPVPQGHEPKQEPVAIPEGFSLIAVKGFDELMYWIDRCERKGHLENCPDLIEPYEAFDYRTIDTHQQPKRYVTTPREPLTDEQIDEIWRTHLHRDSRVRAIEAAHGITSDMKQEHGDKTAKERHKENT